MSLAAYLADADLTFTEFASRLSVEDSTVLRWAKLQRIPSLFWARRIEEVTSGAVPVTCWPAVPVKAPTAKVKQGARARKGRAA